MHITVVKENTSSSYYLVYKTLIGFALLTVALIISVPAFSQARTDNFQFPKESFIPINPTLPNDQLNFDDDSQESCCAKDQGKKAGSSTFARSQSAYAVDSLLPNNTLARSEFELANPRYLENTTPAYLVSCERLATLPELAVAGSVAAGRIQAETLPIVSYSTNVSIRPGATYSSDNRKTHTSDFHIQTAGGNSQVQLQGVSNYSMCMAKGNNVAAIANTDSASIMSYNGSDHIYLSGDNTNMFTRTGAGEDLIELYQTQPQANETTYTAFNIYKTAISGGSEVDTLVLKATPPGTKWCHIGGYRIHGEYFYVVEFALPPTVTEGPRRQRVNIGESVEYVVIKGKKYQLNDFLVHGDPVDTVARQIPIHGSLPYVAVNKSTR